MTEESRSSESHGLSAPESSERGLPPVLGALLLALLTAHVARLLAPMEAQIWAVRTFAVHPVQYVPGAEEAFNSPWQAFLQLAGSAFLHFNWVHLALNAAALLQAGVPVARGLGEGQAGGGRFLSLFVLTAMAGSLVYVLLNWGSPIEAFGASGAACGVFGAYFVGPKGDWRTSLADPQVRAGIAVFLGVNVVLVAGVRTLGLAPIAWEAHLGGFLAGAAAYEWLRPRSGR